jgi:hypothetical protein
MTVPVLCRVMGAVLLNAFVRRCLEPDPSAVLHSSWSVRCTICTRIEPSPTTEATRLTLLDRASPTQNTPGMLLLERLHDVRARMDRPGDLPRSGSAIRSDRPGGGGIEVVGDIDDDLAGQRIPVLGDDRYGAGVRHGEDDDIAGPSSAECPGHGPAAEPGGEAFSLGRATDETDAAHGEGRWERTNRSTWAKCPTRRALRGRVPSESDGLPSILPKPYASSVCTWQRVAHENVLRPLRLVQSAIRANGSILEAAHAPCSRRVTNAGTSRATTTRMTPLPDDELLECLERGAFGYFLEQTNAANGLVADRSLDGSPASIAVVGMALSVYPVAVERGWLTRDDAAASPAAKGRPRPTSLGCHTGTGAHDP